MKKTLAVFLLLCMAFSFCAVPGLAEEPINNPAPTQDIYADAAETPAGEPASGPAPAQDIYADAAAEAPVTGKAALGVTVYEDGSVGVVVANVLPGTPAEKSGLRPGDIIVSFDGTPVSDSDALLAAAQAREDGAPIMLDFLRRGSLCSVTVTPDSGSQLGIQIYSGSAPIGASVAEVTPGGPAEKAGILPGDVIVGFSGDTIIFVDDLVTAVLLSAPGDAVEIELLRDGGRRTAIAVLDEVVEEPAAQAADSAAPVLVVTDLPLSVEVNEGANAALLTIAAKGELDADASFLWYKQGKDGITYPIDSFFVPHPEALGLNVHNGYDEKLGIYTSTLYADGISSAASGTYFCRVLDINGAEIDSSSAAVIVK